jgi:hypothetical protein
MCGNEKFIRAKHLQDGRAESCGNCNYKDTHPEAYTSWRHVRQRCLNPNNPDYKRYGGRGILICKDWLESFTYFLRDMGDPPCDSITGKRYTIDRKDNDGNYTKDNCRWADIYTQANNISSAVHPAIAKLKRSHN